MCKHESNSLRLNAATLRTSRFVDRITVEYQFKVVNQEKIAFKSFKVFKPLPKNNYAIKKKHSHIFFHFISVDISIISV